MSWWDSAQSSPTNSTAAPSLPYLINMPRTAEKTCYDLMDQCSTGTTSHQHYRPSHQPPGHDLVIDLTQGQGKRSAHRQPVRQQHAGKPAIAVPLGITLWSRLGESNPRPTHYEIYAARIGRH